MFDPQSFLDTSIEGANSTQSIPVPAGDYTAVIDKVTSRQWTKKDDPTVSGVALDIIWSIDDQSVKELLDRDKVVVKQGVMLDMNDTGTGLDMGKGKNVGLGRLREALGKNNPGERFSFSQLPGCVAKIRVKHRADKDQIFAEVEAVSRLA